eukprot:scaffold2076_cov106-Cylindrotheca_fusiformis.AAC.2
MTRRSILTPLRSGRRISAVLVTFFLWTANLLAICTSLQSTTTIGKYNNHIHTLLPPDNGEDDEVESTLQHPTLVLIGGMAQTKTSWEHHLPTLCSNGRKVIVYECIGQGNEPNAARSLPLNLSLPFQAEVLAEYLEQSGGRTYDLVGFSLGARVSMAIACQRPELIRSLHLSGVALDRSDYGHLAIRAWKDCIANDPSLKSFAWSVLMATYSSSFLMNLLSSSSLDKFIDHICKSNSPEGLLALLNHAEVTDETDPWHVASMADRIRELSIPGRICVGELDQMAPPKHATELATRLGWEEPFAIPNCGHAVGIEGARMWKSDVIEFLNKQ